MKRIASSPIVDEKGTKRHQSSKSESIVNVSELNVSDISNKSDKIDKLDNDSRIPVDLDHTQCSPHGYPFIRSIHVFTSIPLVIVSICKEYFDGNQPHWTRKWSQLTLATDLTGLPRDPTQFTVHYATLLLENTTINSVMKKAMRTYLFVLHRDKYRLDFHDTFRGFLAVCSDTPSKIRECTVKSTATHQCLLLSFSDVLLRGTEWQFFAEIPVADLLSTRVTSTNIVGQRCIFSGRVFEYFLSLITGTFDFDVTSNILTIHANCVPLQGPKIVAETQPPPFSMSFALQLCFSV